jgi:hypothetical protein
MEAYDSIYNSTYQKCKALEKENALLKDHTLKYEKLRKLYIGVAVALGIIVVVRLILYYWR